MKKEKLTLDILQKQAEEFCVIMSAKKVHNVKSDGKSIGTYIEKEFKKFLEKKYEFEQGNSGKGIDLPGKDINTDIKVTSISQPQSSCPYKNARQKIYGLGYNILVFVYEKIEKNKKVILNFKYCTFIGKKFTSDYKLTKLLRQMLDDEANVEDIRAELENKNLPSDEGGIVLEKLAEEIIRHKPEQGYLTISNALQWRLNYKNVIELDNNVFGIKNYKW